MFKRMIAVAAVLAMAGIPPAFASAPTETKTPPRLSFTQGEVSFWRPGADDWIAARVNTALADGDALYSGNGANLELQVQVGSRAFVRAGENTQIGLENQEPDFLQLKVTGGHVAVDVRELTPGQTIELDTPNAAFTIGRAGYYRVDVADDSTTFVTRRGGEATATPSGGALTAVATNQEAIIQGTDTPQVATYQAPDLDAWDRWNYGRSGSAVAGDGGGALPASMYGSEQLNRYGTWRDTEPYGRVWVPSDVDPTWAPYSTGQWMWDPYYGWTWVDDAPWGWAPYHYGRWVHFDSYWGWAPGPIYAYPVYEPALVAFFGFPGFQVGIGFGTPIGWVALGWGEPLLPWWGSAGFIGRPCWDGWFGPRIVNNVFVNNTTIVNVNNINFVNTRVPHAFVAVAHDRFGNGAVERARIANILHSVDPAHLQPVHGALPVNAGPHSLVAGGGHAFRPPQSMMSRRVVATRAPHTPAVHDPTAARLASGVNPQPRLVNGAQRRAAADTRAAGRQTAATTARLPDAANSRGPLGGTRFAPPPLPHSGATAHTSPSSRGALPRGPQASSAARMNSRFAPPPLPHSGITAHASPSTRGALARGTQGSPQRTSTTRMNSRFAPPPPPPGRGIARGGPAPAATGRAGTGSASNRAVLSNRATSGVSSRWTPPPPPPSSRTAPRGGDAFANNPPSRSTTLSRGAQSPQSRVPPAMAATRTMQPRAVQPAPAAPRMAQPRMVQPQLAPPPRVAPPQVAVPRVAPPRVTAPQAAPPRFSAPQIASSRGAAPRMSAPQMSAPRFQAPRAAAPRAAPGRQDSGRQASGSSRGPARR